MPGRLVEVRLGDVPDLRQHLQDIAVERALQQWVASRLPQDRVNVQVLFCDDPRFFGIPLEALAAVEETAYSHAQYGTRAERMEHFARVFRDYPEDEHRSLRYVLVVERNPEAGYTDILVFGDYFEVRELDRLGPAYAEGVARWMRDHPGRHPGRFITSKLVTNPNKRVSVGLIGLGAYVLAAVLHGLADAEDPDTHRPEGALVAAQAQPDSQKMIRAILGRLVHGLDMLSDQPVSEQQDAPAHMLAYVPPTIHNDV